MNTKKMALVVCVASVALYGSQAYARLDEIRQMTIQVQYENATKPGTSTWDSLGSVTLNIEKSETVDEVKRRVKTFVEESGSKVGQVRRVHLVKLFINGEELGKGDYNVTIDNLLREDGPLVVEGNVIKSKEGNISAQALAHKRKNPARRK